MILKLEGLQKQPLRTEPDRALWYGNALAMGEKKDKKKEIFFLENNIFI